MGATVRNNVPMEILNETVFRPCPEGRPLIPYINQDMVVGIGEHHVLRAVAKEKSLIWVYYFDEPFPPSTADHASDSE
jgi:hypothetical protein